MSGTTRPRRALVVVSGAAAAGLAMAAHAVDRRIAGEPDGGWFLYAPNEDVVFSPDPSRSHRTATAVVWLGAALGLGALT